MSKNTRDPRAKGVKLITGKDGQELDGMVMENGMVIRMLPTYVIDLYEEMATYHPPLLNELRNIAKDDNYSPEVFYGCIAAYCGIVLDGGYAQEYLAESLLKELHKKRGIITINTGDIVTIPKDMLQ